MYGAGFDDPEPPVDGEATFGRGERHAPRRNRLEDVARQDVLLEALDDVPVLLSAMFGSPVASEDSPAAQQRRGGRRGDLSARPSSAATAPS